MASTAPYNGHPPFEKTSATSKATAAAIAPKTASLRERVLAAIRDAGARGMTDDELEQLLGCRHQTISARRRELVLQGYVRSRGPTRKTRSGHPATVWAAVEGAPVAAPPAPPKAGRGGLALVLSAEEARQLREDLRWMYVAAKQQGYELKHPQAVAKLQAYLKAAGEQG